MKKDRGEWLREEDRKRRQRGNKTINTVASMLSVGYILGAPLFVQWVASAFLPGSMAGAVGVLAFFVAIGYWSRFQDWISWRLGQ